MYHWLILLATGLSVSLSNSVRGLTLGMIAN